MTIKEAAVELGITEEAVRQRIYRGSIIVKREDYTCNACGVRRRRVVIEATEVERHKQAA